MPDILNQFKPALSATTDQPMQGPPDMSGQYNTQLSPQQEIEFRKWMSKHSMQIGRDVSKDLFNYDLRGAWKSDAKAASNGHLPDTWKKPNHPSFSVDSEYSGQNGMIGGKWAETKGKWSYSPSATNLQMYSPQGLTQYFKEDDPDVNLIMPGKQ